MLCRRYQTRLVEFQRVKEGMTNAEWEAVSKAFAKHVEAHHPRLYLDLSTLGATVNLLEVHPVLHDRLNDGDETRWTTIGITEAATLFVQCKRVNN